jgi:hypothetical protein
MHPHNLISFAGGSETHPSPYNRTHVSTYPWTYLIPHIRAYNDSGDTTEYGDIRGFR